MDINRVAGAIILVCGVVIVTLMVIQPGTQTLVTGAGGGLAGLGTLIMFRRGP